VTDLKGALEVEPAVLDTLVKSIGDAYAFFDSLQVSVTTMVIALVIVTFGFFFALREAATWFLKIDDLKSDVRRLRDLVLMMEGEVRVLQALVPERPRVEPTELAPKPAPVETKTATPPVAAPKTFPISH
jgi:hypothetical protein